MLLHKKNALTFALVQEVYSNKCSFCLDESFELSNAAIYLVLVERFVGCIILCIILVSSECKLFCTVREMLEREVKLELISEMVVVMIGICCN
jgi:hypothetical protein